MRIITAMIAVILLAQAGTASENSNWAGLGNFMHPLGMWIEKLSHSLLSNQTVEAKNASNIIEKPLNKIEKKERLNEPRITENNSGTSERVEEEYTSRSEEIHGQSTTGNNVYNKVTNIQTSTGKKIIVTKVVVSRSRTGEIERTVSTSTTNQNSVETNSPSGEKATNPSGENKVQISTAKSRTEELEHTVNTSITPKNTVDTNSSSGESRIEVSTVSGNTPMYAENGSVSMYTENGDASMYTEGSNGSVATDGDNMIVSYATNSSTQMVII